MCSDTDFTSRSGERYAHCGRKQECGVQKETGALAPSLAAQIWTVPNLISASRLLLVPVFAVLIAQHMDGWALFILAISGASDWRSEEHTSELQSRGHLVCRLLLEKKKNALRT